MTPEQEELIIQLARFILAYSSAPPSDPQRAALEHAVGKAARAHDWRKDS